VISSSYIHERNIALCVNKHHLSLYPLYIFFCEEYVTFFVETHASSISFFFEHFEVICSCCPYSKHLVPKSLVGRTYVFTHIAVVTALCICLPFIPLVLFILLARNDPLTPPSRHGDVASECPTSNLLRSDLVVSQFRFR